MGVCHQLRGQPACALYDVVRNEGGLVQRMASAHQILNDIVASRREDCLAVLVILSCRSLRADSDRESRDTLLQRFNWRIYGSTQCASRPLWVRVT